MTAGDLVNAGYTGYQGWGDREAEADFKATGGSGKGGASSGGSSGGFQSLSPSDVANLRQQVVQIIHPYYQQLAEQAQGDFQRAVSQMTTDYRQGVKSKKESYALQRSISTGELQNTLAQLGIANTQDQMKTIDDLGKRGILAVQTSPNGQINSPTVSAINSNPDFTGFTPSATIANKANPMSQGQAGFELSQLQEQQRLRSEAEQRAKLAPLQQSGLQLKQYTNAPDNFDPNNINSSLQGVDRSTLGTAELGLISGQNQAAENQRNRLQDLNQQQASQVNNLSSGLAAVGAKDVSEQLRNQLQQEQKQQFVGTGTT